MKKFLAIYTGTAAGVEKSGWNAMTDRERQEREQAGIRGWEEWGKAHADSIVDDGTPLGKTKRASADGIADAKNGICAYTVVRAESHEAAVKLFENHPHFTIFPGDAVEVMECLPLPAGNA